MRRLPQLAVLCAAAAVALIVLALSTFLVEQRLTPLVSFSFVGGLALVVLYVILEPGAVVDLLTNRRSWVAGQSALATLAVVAILVAANVLAAHGTQALDLTRAKFNTLAPESVKATQRLASDLQVTGFFGANDVQSERSAQDLLSLYQAQSPHVKVRYVDPQSNADLARQLGVHESSTLVLQYRGRSQILAPGSQSEQDVTAALLALESSRTPDICWTVGEGERDLTDQSQLDGYSEAASQISKNNFQETDFLASQARAVPGSCDVVALVGPQRPLSAAAQALLGAYLAAGGKLLVAADHWPDPATLASLSRLLQPYGLSFDGGVVVDLAQAAQNDPTTPAVFNYGDSPITKGLGKQVGFFPQSSGITLSAQAATPPTSIASSSAESYEVMQRRQNLARQPGDRGGPLTLMASAEAAAGSRDTRIVAVGTSGFAENAALNSPDTNVQLFVGSLQWLSHQENLISLPPRPQRIQSLALSNEQANLNIFLTLILLPALVALGGIAVWYRRRFSY